MPRVKAPEIVTGARGPRDTTRVTHVSGPEVAPQVRAVELRPEQVHFVSSFKEYSIVVMTEPDRVNSSGEIVKGKNKAVRFKDFTLITSDKDVIDKLRSLREYGLRRDVWEKWQQDQDLATKALATAEAAIDNLPPDMQQQFAERLVAKFGTFQLSPRPTPTEIEKAG